MGLIGFVAGRQSVGSTPLPPPLIADGAPYPRKDTAPVPVEVLNIPLRDDQLAGLFLHPGAGEGIFGKEPVTIETTSSP
jgi:hypothetical protein